MGGYSCGHEKMDGQPVAGFTHRQRRAYGFQQEKALEETNSHSVDRAGFVAFGRQGRKYFVREQRRRQHYVGYGEVC